MKKPNHWPLLILFIFLFCLLFIFQKEVTAKQARTVRATDSIPIQISTALGFSTVLEFQTKPLQAVLGDQSAFKIEYLGNSITLKPLLTRSKSNLFVYTDYDRFTFDIKTGNGEAADYLVKIRKKETIPIHSGYPIEKEFLQKRILIQRKSRKENLTLYLKQMRIDKFNSQIEFEISSLNKSYSFGAESFALKQNKKSLHCEAVFLESSLVHPSHSVQGVISLANQDWNRALPLTFVFAFFNRHQNTERIEISSSAHVSSTKKPEAKKNEKIPELFRSKSK